MSDKPIPDRFTDQKRRICSQAEADGKWGLDKHGLYCTLCGHIFRVGDGWRWVYANDGGGGHGNFEVCDACDGPDVLERYRAACTRIDEISRPYPHARWEIILASKLIVAEAEVEIYRANCGCGTSFDDPGKDHYSSLLLAAEAERDATATTCAQTVRQLSEAIAERDLWLAKHSDCQFVISGLQEQNRQLRATEMRKEEFINALTTRIHGADGLNNKVRTLQAQNRQLREAMEKARERCTWDGMKTYRILDAALKAKP